jgi:L-lactate dehydrogenase complex protein LldG
MSSGKQKEILGRIREALKIAAPVPHVAHQLTASQLLHPKAWLPAVPPDQPGQLALFQKNCLQLKTEFCLVRGTDEAGRIAKELRQKYGWNLAASHHQIQLDAVVRTLGIETLYIEDHPAQTALEKCSVGITACDALVAQTGSILLTARSAGGRALSVLPPHHLVVAQIDQLVADLPAAFELLSATYEGNLPSFATFITGPSRTGDIERILVLGAHGPRMLTVIIVE